MLFAHDTAEALVMGAALVNTLHADGEGSEPVDDLDDRAGLEAFLAVHPMSGSRRRNATEVEQVRQLRADVAELWSRPDADSAVPVINELFAVTGAKPYLTRHDAYDWHLHMTEAEQPLALRMGAEIAMAVADLVRMGDFDRLRRCAADDCDAVLVDLSKNRSRRFCDTGNCANRAHVAAYRARQKSR